MYPIPTPPLRLPAAFREVSSEQQATAASISQYTFVPLCEAQVMSLPTQ